MLIHFSPLNSGQPLYSGQITWSQCVLNREVPLYMVMICVRARVCVYVCACMYYACTEMFCNHVYIYPYLYEVLRASGCYVHNAEL